MKLRFLSLAAAVPTIILTAALIWGVSARASSQAGHFSLVYVADEGGEPLVDENGHYYLLADDGGRLMSGSSSLRTLFSARLSESAEGESDIPSVNAVTADRYFYRGRFYEDAALTVEIKDLGRLFPGFLTGEMTEHTIYFDETGESLKISQTGYGAKGVLKSFDGVSRQVFSADAGGALSYMEKLGYADGRLYTDGSMSEQLRVLPAVAGLTPGEEAMYYIDGSERAIVLRARESGGAAGFLADPYDPSFREPLFTTDQSGIIRYLGDVTLYTPDGGGVRFFFDGDNILDGELNTAEEVAGLAPEREGMIFSGFFADIDGSRIPLTDRTGFFAASFDDPQFKAWRDGVKEKLTDSRVTIEGHAEYCYEFLIPNGDELTPIYSDGEGWFAEEQLANSLDTLSDIVALPDISPAHFAGYYLTADDGTTVRLADGEGNFVTDAAGAIAAIGNRGGTAFERSYRILTLTDGDDAWTLYFDGEGYYSDDALMESAEGAFVPEIEREEIYGFPVDEDGNELPHDEDAEPELIKTIVRTCVGFYLLNEDGALVEDEEGEPAVLAVSAEDGSIVLDWSEAPWGDVTAIAVWEEEEVYPEGGTDESRGGKEDKQAPDKKKKKTTKSKDKDEDGDEDKEKESDNENAETTEPESGGDAPAGDETGGAETTEGDTDDGAGDNSGADDGASKTDGSGDDSTDGKGESGSGASSEGASDGKEESGSGASSEGASDGKEESGSGASSEGASDGKEDSGSGASSEGASDGKEESGSGASSEGASDESGSGSSEETGADSGDGSSEDNGSGDAGTGASYDGGDKAAGSDDAGEGSGASGDDNAAEGASYEAEEAETGDAGTGASEGSSIEEISDSATEATSEAAPDNGGENEKEEADESQAASEASSGASSGDSTESGD